MSITKETQLFQGDTTIKFSQKWIDENISMWQKRMNLGDWDIRTGQLNGADGNLFQIRTIRERKSAVLYYHPNSQCSWKDATLGIIHELGHLMLDNMREEHDFQVHYKAKDVAEEYKARFTRQLEKSVETIARAIYSAYCGYEPS